jgi:L-iditol 2-dehydrogenase
MFTVLLRAQGARVLVVGRRPARLAILAAHGAEVLLPGAHDRGVDAASLVGAATAGRGVDAVVDAAGDPDRTRTLAALVARGGTLLLFSGMARDAELTIPAARLHYDEVDVVGSFHYRPGDASDALSALDSGAFPARALVDDSRPLASWREAFARHESGVGMKTVLRP